MLVELNVCMKGGHGRCDGGIGPDRSHAHYAKISSNAQIIFPDD